MTSPPGRSAMNEHTATDHELVDEENLIANQMEQPFVDSQTPEPPLSDQQNGTTTSPGTPSELPDFDWEDFEARFDKALREADEAEREILKEATGLSKYFQAWASAASAHDNERASKRLQTRQRYVNLSEEKFKQKQQHYEEVVRAFESALALLQSS